MTDSTTSTPSTIVLSKIEQVLADDLSVAYENATPEDHQAAAALMSPKGKPRKAIISSNVSAVIYTKHNCKNRDLRISKVRDYSEAMQRGEWKYNHQGIAASEEGKLLDGQHRLAASAISGLDLPVMVSPNMTPEMMDTVDRSTRRSAGEALEMLGISSGKLKAQICKIVMAYIAEERGQKHRFTDQQIEGYAQAHEEMLENAIAIGEASVENVTEPAMKKTLAQYLVMLMLEGGWPPMMVTGFIAAIQQGVATYPQSPTIVLTKMYLKSNLSERKTDRLTTKVKLALAMKGAALWSEDKSVARLAWKPQEQLPSHMMPLTVETEQAA